MSCLKDLFTGMRARDVVFMSGYALYLTFGYMSFESPTVLTSLGESGDVYKRQVDGLCKSFARSLSEDAELVDKVSGEGTDDGGN